MVLVAVALGLFLDEFEDFLEPWLEPFEVVGLACFHPFHLGVRRYPRHFLDQTLREFPGTVVRPAPFAQIDPAFGCRVAGQAVRRFGGRKPFPHLGVGELMVDHSRQERFLLCPVGRVGGGHVNFLVPAQDPGGIAQKGYFLHAFQQFFIRGFGGHGFFPFKTDSQSRKQYQLEPPNSSRRSEELFKKIN